jgi:4-amino-4-deoxy-L-arabinose transferase-like glycosyltransferase
MINIIRFNKIDFLVLIGIVIIGLIHLPFPFDGDQAFFRLGAFEMQQGKVLYRDFWDVKQPGIFYFYFLAGTFFGFNEVGIHLFELIYMVFFSIILLLTLRSYFQHRIIASLVPLLTVGVYYTVSEPWHLTQVEALVNFPLFICLWLTHQCFKYEGKQRFILLLLSGFVGGIVLIFKLMFLLILVSFWLTFLIYSILIKRQKISNIFAEIFLPIFLGIIFPLLIVVSYFAWFNSLPILFQTFFLYPPKIIAKSEFNPINFFSGIKWFLNGFYPLLLAATIAVDVSLRKSKNILTLLLVVWCIFGWGVIILQRGAFWEYHYLLLFVPIGILATKGLDVLWKSLKRLSSPITTILLIFLFFLPLSHTLIKKSAFLVNNNFALTEDARFNYQAVFRQKYPSLRSEAEFISQSKSIPGEIYVAGDPAIYYFSNRTQATSLRGWALEYFLPEQWSKLLEELDSSKPPYIFIDYVQQPTIKKDFPKMLEFIGQRYRILRQNDEGIWYVLL